MREDQYDYIINKPELNEDTLAHYGIKGMKWRKHLKGVKAKITGGIKQKIYNKGRKRDFNQQLDYVNGKIVNDIKDRKSSAYAFGAANTDRLSPEEFNRGLKYEHSYRLDTEMSKYKKRNKKR